MVEKLDLARLVIQVAVRVLDFHGDAQRAKPQEPIQDLAAVLGGIQQVQIVPTVAVMEFLDQLLDYKVIAVFLGGVAWALLHYRFLVSILNIVFIPFMATGGCVLPEWTVSQTRPKRRIESRSRRVGFQRDTQTCSFVQTGKEPHCSSVMPSGFNRFLFAIGKLIGFIE